MESARWRAIEWPNLFGRFQIFICIRILLFFLKLVVEFWWCLYKARFWEKFIKKECVIVESHTHSQEKSFMCENLFSESFAKGRKLCSQGLLVLKI